MAPRISKLNVWLKHYLNDGCSTTFLNKAESARRAGYKTVNENSLKSIGCQNFTKLKDKINTWMDESGLSESRLKQKLVTLMEAKETKFNKMKGSPSGDLPHGTSIVAQTEKLGWIGSGENAEAVDDGDTLIAIEVAAIETQRKTLDMALKVKGMNAPEKHVLTGKDGGPVAITDFPPEIKTIDEWLEYRKSMEDT